MALVQMRTPNGSYSMVDEKLVPIYEAEGYVLTSELPEFKTKNVTFYDEARRTVTTTEGEEKPVEEVIEQPQMGFREERKKTTTLTERAQRSRNYTADEWQTLVNAPLEEKLEMIKNNAANGMKLTPSQKYFLDKQYKLEASDINNAQDEGKSGLKEPGPSGRLQPGQAGYGIDTWYEFLGYLSENDAMADFVKGIITPADIRRAEAEIEPEPADIIVDLDKVKNSLDVKNSDWARVTPSGQRYVSLLESIELIENSAFGSTIAGQNAVNSLKAGTVNNISVSGNETGNPNLGSGLSSEEVVTTGECPPGFKFDESIKACVPIDDGEPGNGEPPPGNNGGTGQITNTAFTQFNNIPEDGLLWNVGGNFYIVYEVPGSQGELYDGNPLYLAYELKDNDLFSAGLLSQGETAPQPNATMDQAFFDAIAIVTGNTDQLSAEIDNPFASFVETITEQSQVAPWITDPEMLALIAEAAVEGRTVSDAEWQTTNWYRTHSEAEREWLRTYYEDPSTAAQSITDGQIAIANALQASGVANAPEALVNWIADKFVTGQWTQNYTTEQISLFADPYATGKRDTDFESYLTSTAITGVDRTSQREAEVRELYAQYLGPVLGKITDSEAAELAGRLRNDPDFKDQLIAGLKQSRLAAFSNYTNPELTYEDIARPWRNLTASVWGQSADETQGWWQEMVKTNDFAKAEETLRTKGLELDVTQVTQDASSALTQALGQGNISQLGVNV
jgi:flagellar motility protein MotE (MotC chaperone)